MQHPSMLYGIADMFFIYFEDFGCLLYWHAVASPVFAQKGAGNEIGHHPPRHWQPHQPCSRSSASPISHTSNQFTAASKASSGI